MRIEEELEMVMEMVMEMVIGEIPHVEQFFIHLLFLSISH